MRAVCIIIVVANRLMQPAQLPRLPALCTGLLDRYCFVLPHRCRLSIHSLQSCSASATPVQSSPHPKLSSNTHPHTAPHTHHRLSPSTPHMPHTPIPLPCLLSFIAPPNPTTAINLSNLLTSPYYTTLLASLVKLQQTYPCLCTSHCTVQPIYPHRLINIQSFQLSSSCCPKFYHLPTCYILYCTTNRFLPVAPTSPVSFPHSSFPPNPTIPIFLYSTILHNCPTHGNNPPPPVPPSSSNSTNFSRFLAFHDSSRPSHYCTASHLPLYRPSTATVDYTPPQFPYLSLSLSRAPYASHCTVQAKYSTVRSTQYSFNRGHVLRSL